MKFCFAAIPGYGHTFPLVPLAAAAQSAGHDVLFVCRDDFAGRLPVPVAGGVPADLTLQAAEQEAVAAAGDRDDPLWFPRAMFGTVMPRHTAPLLRELWETDGRPDLLVYDVANLGPARVAAEAGVPAFAFNVGMHPEGWLTILRPGIESWPRWLIDPAPSSWSEWAAPAGTERLPIRSVAWSDAAGVGADWLAGAASGPRGYLTLGTVSFGAVEVLRRSILATARVCERVLVAAGPDGDPAALGDQHVPEPAGGGRRHDLHPETRLFQGGAQGGVEGPDLGTEAEEEHVRLPGEGEKGGDVGQARPGRGPRGQQRQRPRVDRPADPEEAGTVALDGRDPGEDDLGQPHVRSGPGRSFPPPTSPAAPRARAPARRPRRSSNRCRR